MKASFYHAAVGVMFLAGVSFLGGCASSSESAGRDELTANVGKYPTGPAGVAKPRVGVPSFNVQGEGHFTHSDSLDNLAADQMNTLLDASDRFAVIERTQLDKLLKEQHLEGVVTPGELAKTGQVRGVDYLLIGKVTNLRVKTEKKSTGFGLANVGGIFGAADYKKKDVSVVTECGVDIRLVNPSTGEVWVSNSSDYKRTDAASAIGIEILGANAEADADIDISDDDKGKVLRLALDDAVRKSLPKVDKKLQELPKPAVPAAAAAVPSPSAAATPAPAVRTVACTQCSAAVPEGAKFCPKCGAKMP
jgi:curli biogenesis system outer membrane secretion channel CsgG